METLKINCIIRGISPLIQNRYPDESKKVDGAESKRKKKVYIDKDEAEIRLYKDGDTICQPANHIESALISAATNYKFEGKKTYKDPFKGGIFISPIMIPHKYQNWDIDRRPVVVERRRVMRARPIFNQWELEFQIECIDDRISVDVIKEVLDYAGLYKGLGDMRPRFGRFEVIKFEKI